MVKQTYFFNNDAGMRQNINPLSHDKGEASYIENLHMTKAGTWSSQNIGYEKLTAQPLANEQAIMALARHVTPAGTSYTLAHCDGKLFSVTLPSGQATEVGGGLSSTSPATFASFLGWLFIAGDSHSPKRWNTVDSLEALPNWPPTISGVTVGNPSLVTTYANRLILSGDSNNPSTVYISALEDPTNFTPGANADDAGAIKVSPGDGDKITALRRLFLPLTNEEVLLIFKQRSVYVLTGQDSLSFELQQLSGVVGAVSQQAVLQIGQDIFFFSEQGVNSLNTTTFQGNLKLGSLSQVIDKQLQLLNPNTKAQIHAAYLEHRQEIWWFVAEGSSAQNNRVYVLNLSQSKPVWSIRNGINARCSLVLGTRLYTGNYEGDLFQQLSSNLYDGDPFTWTYRTPFYDLDRPANRKRLTGVDIHLSYLGNEGLTLKTLWDFQTAPTQVLSASLGSTSTGETVRYGSAVYGNAVYGGSSVFVPSNRGVLHLHPIGSGKSVQLELTGDMPAQAVTLDGFKLTHITGGLH